MSKTKAKKTSKPVKVKAAAAHKPAKPIKQSKSGSAAKATPRTPAKKTAKHARHQPRSGKPAGAGAAAEPVAPEAEVIIKTIKWPATELKQFRERLQKLHDRVVDDIGFLAGGHLANSQDGVVGKSGGYSQDSTEDGTENFAQDLSLMQVSNKQDMLNKIIDAFRRLDQRTYGLCEECGCLIAKPRLEVQPFATKCIKCQSAAEANRPRSQGFRKSVVQMLDTDVG